MRCQRPKEHSTKGLRLFYTTYTIDFDDPDRYMTAEQDMLLGGQRETVTTRGWVLWPPLIAAVCISIVFILAGLAAAGTSTAGTLMPALSVLGAVAVLPLLIFFARAAIPPRVEERPKGEG